MKKLYFVFIFIIVVQTIALSQSCFPEGIEFSTQEQIDNFHTNYPNCTEIEGDVTISGLDISSLSGLNVITSLGNNLYISFNPVLTNITRLKNITSILGNIWIGSNPVLLNLEGLNNLSSINGDFVIEFNDTLSNLNALSNLTFIGGDYKIWYNPILSSLSGLNNLNNIGGKFNIEGNSYLSNLSGLDNLTQVNGDLTIEYNTSLVSLTGLGSLNVIRGRLWLLDNDILTSLTGLMSLDSIEGWLYIVNNDSLTNLAGLDNIEAESISTLNISLNNSLSNCAVESVCNYLMSPNGTITIHDNKAGCNNETEVEEACENLSVPAINSKPKFSIYPNPANSQIFISHNNEINIDEITIYSLQGLKVYYAKGINGGIDISKLLKGIYIVEISSNEIKVRNKLTIE